MLEGKSRGLTLQLKSRSTREESLFHRKKRTEERSVSVSIVEDDGDGVKGRSGTAKVGRGTRLTTRGVGRSLP